MNKDEINALEAVMDALDDLDLSLIEVSGDLTVIVAGGVMGTLKIRGTETLFIGGNV